MKQLKVTRRCIIVPQVSYRRDNLSFNSWVCAMQMFENEHAYRRAHILVKLFPHVLETIVKFAFHLDSKDTEAQTFLPRHLNLN